MKIIHTADIHLGSQLKSKFTNEISRQRKAEVTDTFLRMVEFAEENDVHAILLSGDVFDSEKEGLKEKKTFFDTVKKHSKIDFLYLNGNHDEMGSYAEEIPNLKKFGAEELSTYEYGSIAVSGIEITDKSAETFYDKIKLPEDKINILMLHGEISDTKGNDKIKLKELKDRGIDYLALGHIHSFGEGKIDERGTFAYPGCLEGRGFDECGEKGFILLEIGENINRKFVPFAKRTIHELKMELTGDETFEDIKNKVLEATKDIKNDDIVRIELNGEIDAGIEIGEEDVKLWTKRFYFVNVKIDLLPKINPADYKSDKTLTGEFIRLIESRDYDEKMKIKLIALGLKAINGRDL